MYSVEDLLISHGYKLPRNAPPSSSSSSSCEAAQANGREAYAARGGGGRPPPAKSCPGPAGRAAGAGVCGDGNQGDTRQQRPGTLHSSSDSGFFNGTRELYSHQQREPEREERDMFYWRRRGHDFSLLLDYADGRELRAAAGGLGRAEGARRAQAAAPPQEERRADRQRWDESAWLRVRDAAQGQWRAVGASAAGDRKCQSLGTEEWRPALGLGRHLSDGEGKLWAQEQAYRAPAEGAVHPRTKGKSQSLPRVLSPENFQQAHTPASLLDGYPGHRLNGPTSHVPHAKHRYPPYHYHYHYHHNSNVAGSRDPWMESSSSSSSRISQHMALLPKPRFSRPLKPPSYEAHQQTRGSTEMLAGDQVPKSKDGEAASSSEGGGPMGRDSFAHDAAAGSGAVPPGYIPPPSYKRPFLYRGGQRGNCEALSLQFQVEEVKEQVPGSTELGRWYSRHVGSSWLEHQRDRSAPCREPTFPGRPEEEAEEGPLGPVQYLPFDDPRVRHISGGSCGNSLVELDEIRSVDKEVPSANVLGQSTHDSAFLPPQELILPDTDASETSLSERDGGNRQHSDLHKGSDDSAVSDVKGVECPSAFLVKPIWQNRNPDRGVPPETVTQVKKIEPGGAETEKSKSAKRKLTETIFCLVSIPIRTPSVADDAEPADREKPTDLAQGSDEDGSGHLQNQSLLSTSSTDLELQALTGGMKSNRGPKKHPVLGKEVHPLHPGHDLSSGSWPGDQYRDQETQTCSPEVPRAPPQGLADQQAQDQPRSASDTTTDSGVGTDCSNRYGYPMKGQKNLNQSSNSAFSRTSNFASGPLQKSTAQSPPPPPPPPQPQPSGNREEPDCLPAQKGQNQSRGKPPSAGSGPEAFGQFLLKPISRRPWDAIEELESFNKELQQQIIKGSSVDQCIEDLDEAYRDILELETVSNNIIETVQIPERQKADPDQVPPGEHLGRTDKARRALESWTATADPTYREVKSAFSRPAGKSVSFSFSKPPKREEAPPPPEIGFREYASVSSQITEKPAGGCRCGNAANTDAFAPKESWNEDEADRPEHAPVEAPWAARQPMQDASTLTSPPDYEDVCHALQLTREPTVGVSRGVTAKLGSAGASAVALPQTPSFKVVTFAALGTQQDGPPSLAEALRDAKKERNSLPRFRGERSLNVLLVRNQRDRFRGRGASRCIVGKDGDGAAAAASCSPSSSSSSSSSEDDYHNNDPDKRFDSRKQQTVAEKQREVLSTDEKSDGGAPAEDLSNLCEVKCAKGIPENESLEDRAARILGINVPAESLGKVEQKGGGEQLLEFEMGGTVERRHISLIGMTKFGSTERMPHVLWRRRHKEADIDINVALDPQDKETGGATGRGGGGSENHLGPASGFPEFPGERLRLSVALDRRGGRGRGRGPSRAIEALQDRLTAPSCRAAAERLARMREVDSVSRMRRLSARSSDSGDEPEDGGAAAAAAAAYGAPRSADR
ncbi:LOW QUALITY PROTEIN: junctional protein associated with coronary artery disease-like, partial [Anguilla anguilla]|uniref:LOW QUALITY PROTEIN: junctional protein associated with coronary artery disease-like n=1 Tax=Anguilla anguilla TaxID=7936 RepID=UPI0015B1C3B1